MMIAYYSRLVQVPVWGGYTRAVRNESVRSRMRTDKLHIKPFAAEEALSGIGGTKRECL
jgi:hypothetical protein